MKIKLWASEVYPVFVQSDWMTGQGTEVEISEGLWNEYLAAKAIFMEKLDAVEDLVLAQHKNGV